MAERLVNPGNKQQRRARTVDEVKLSRRCETRMRWDYDATDADQRRQRAFTAGSVADTYETDRNAEQLTRESDIGMRTHRV